MTTYIPVLLLQVQEGRKSAERTGQHGKNKADSKNKQCEWAEAWGEPENTGDRFYRGTVMTSIIQEFSTRKECDTLDLYPNRN